LDTATQQQHLPVKQLHQQQQQVKPSQHEQVQKLDHSLALPTMQQQKQQQQQQVHYTAPQVRSLPPGMRVQHGSRQPSAAAIKTLYPLGPPPYASYDATCAVGAVSSAAAAAEPAQKRASGAAATKAPGAAGSGTAVARNQKKPAITSVVIKPQGGAAGFGSTAAPASGSLPQMNAIGSNSRALQTDTAPLDIFGHRYLTTRKRARGRPTNA
jgi:hypothetical protein